jgi:hypothetical protein
MQHCLLSYCWRQYPGRQFLEHVILGTIWPQLVHRAPFLKQIISGKIPLSRMPEAVQERAAQPCVGIAQPVQANAGMERGVSIFNRLLIQSLELPL